MEKWLLQNGVYDKNYKAWYYLKGNGSYARSEWQKDYYLKADGKIGCFRMDTKFS